MPQLFHLVTKLNICRWTDGWTDTQTFLFLRCVSYFYWSLSLFPCELTFFHCELTIIYEMKSFVFFCSCVPLVSSYTQNVCADGRMDRWMDRDNGKSKCLPLWVGAQKMYGRCGKKLSMYRWWSINISLLYNLL